MVLFFTATLVISILGLTSLLLIKRWEMQTGNVLWARVRPAIGGFFHRRLVWIEHAAPALVRSGSGHLYRKARATVRTLFARIVLLVEQGLEFLLGFLRRVTEAPRGEGEASAFLKEVGEYKKKLVRENGEKTITEE
jgi:hypothetical protein